MSKFLSFFMSYDSEGGSYSLTSAGMCALAVLILIAMLVAAFIANTKQKGVRFSAKVLAFSGVAIALAYITSFIIYELPFGGSITLFSMLFICLIGYWYGVKVGFITAFAFSVLQFMQSGSTYFLSPFQICCDYIFAFTALGIAGFFKDKKNGLLTGYILSIITRGIFSTIAGYVYWMSYMPESFPKSISFLYPLVYNYTYILVEGIATIIVISLPPVKKALMNIKKIAE